VKIHAYKKHLLSCDYQIYYPDQEEKQEFINDYTVKSIL